MCSRDAGNDPIHNPMNYSPDSCMTQVCRSHPTRLAFSLAAGAPTLLAQVCCLDGQCVQNSNVIPPRMICGISKIRVMNECDHDGGFREYACAWWKI